MEGVKEECSDQAFQEACLENSDHMNLLISPDEEKHQEGVSLSGRETAEKSIETVKFDSVSLIDFGASDCQSNNQKNDGLASGIDMKKSLEVKNDLNEERIKALEKEIMQLRRKLQCDKDHKLVEITNLKATVRALQGEKESLKADVQNLHQNMRDWLQRLSHNVEASISHFDNLYQRDTQEKRELLLEMTSMNEELNRRGETISSLKEVVSMYEKKVIELNSQQDCNMSMVKQLREELTDRTQRLHDLANQQDANNNTISQLREELQNASARLQEMDSQQNVSNDTIKQLRDQLADATLRAQSAEQELARVREREHPVEGDHLSTSTVSRVEEASRLKDVEDSFEDRYCKLKVVAAKLKKRATETQQLLDTERQKWATERAELGTKLTQLTGTARNNQKLQQELDIKADELEEERKQLQVMRKAATDAKAAEVSLKVKLEEAQTNIEILKINLDSAIKERDSATNALEIKKTELDTALKEKLAEELIRKEKAKEVTNLEEKLKEEQDKIVTLEKAAENAKMESRKQSVLSLEIQSYEKGLSDMNAQLGVERGRVNSLEAEVSTLQDIRDSLQEQIRLLEERVATEEARSQQMHEQLVQNRASLQEAESRVRELEDQVAQLTERLERERATNEAATLELATLSSAVQTNTDLMLREKQELTQQVSSLSLQLTALQATLTQTEAELVEVRADFDKYKVRAHSVLRKHQSAAVSQAETDALQQAEELKSVNETLRTKLDKTVTEVEKLREELKIVSGEREAAETRCLGLNTALAEKGQQLDRAMAEHRSQKLSLDTLVNCYKTQLEEKEALLQERTSALTKELEAIKSQLKERGEGAPPPTVARAEETVAGAESLPRAEPPLLPREDGEGSEYIPEYSPSCSPPRVSPKLALLPLDKLLESNDSLHGEREQLEVELANLKAELECGRKRAHHQAALLADTEQDAARKEQLITVLKKEIGRLERCIERQPHAQNTEYLKNIVFKFVTLEMGEDRVRLVPVLTTLLQLSPEETQRLSDIAKGQSTEGGLGWGSYFPGWR